MHVFPCLPPSQVPARPILAGIVVCTCLFYLRNETAGCSGRDMLLLSGLLPVLTLPRGSWRLGHYETIRGARPALDFAGAAL